MSVLALLLRHTTKGIVGISLVQPVVFVQNADAIRLDGGDGTEQVPHDFEVVVHLAPAAHHIPNLRVLPTVARAAGHRVALEEVDVLSRHLRIPHQKAPR